jgi:nucleoside-diphosphate-sugar epimerase
MMVAMGVDRRLPGSAERQTVLITGSSGALGNAIAAATEAAGWIVRGVDRVPGRSTTVISDLRESHVRRAAVAGVETVVHVAALHAPHVGQVPNAEFQSVNVSVTDALLTEATRGSMSRFVYTSSTSLNGPQRRPRSDIGLVLRFPLSRGHIRRLCWSDLPIRAR